MSHLDAIAAVERALVSQPPEFAAQYVEVADDFIVYGQGAITTVRGGSVVVPVGGVAVAGGRSRSESKALQNRIYFDSIVAVELYARRGKFVVKVITNDGQPPQQFYAYSEKVGRALVDGISSLKAEWSAERARASTGARPSSQAGGSGAAGAGSKP
jgi:hypothetical protein